MGDGYIYPYTEQLAKRTDMIEIEFNPEQAPVSSVSVTQKQAAEPQNPEEEEIDNGEGADLEDETENEAPETAPEAPEEAVNATDYVNTMNAKELKAFAQDKFGVNLDARKGVDTLRAQVAELISEASI